MAGFFQRLFAVGSAEAHGVIDKLEDPVKMTEQGIRDLKKDLASATESFAEIKSIQIRSEKDMLKAKEDAKTWEQKAMTLLQQGEQGKIAKADSDRLALEALKRKEEGLRKYSVAAQENQRHSQTVLQVQGNIEKLKSSIQQYENELVTLKARSVTASATTKINKQLSGVDSKGTVQMLERMRQKVDEQEDLAQAYGEIAQQPSSIDDEIEQALLNNQSPEVKQIEESSELAALKSRMGIE